ncbi:glycosyl hydrolase family 28-related protein [Modestobacter roseus]|uniref:Pectate lyase-like protein n=1 Tax=Modestobacter roseus TaxID=1181884 RepID=A0A562IWZ3_9ACTN|nr:right-handed parallel beta-helix repeat-containing protein [Modestobacter roseus]TWH75360.1 pectate lyase-like protein [Modestobacter roseus]
MPASAQDLPDEPARGDTARRWGTARRLAGVSTALLLCVAAVTGTAAWAGGDTSAADARAADPPAAEATARTAPTTPALARDQAPAPSRAQAPATAAGTAAAQAGQAIARALPSNPPASTAPGTTSPGPASAPTAAAAASTAPAMAALPAGTRTAYVDQFGAVGNGVTDDTRALQRAFDTVPSGTTLVFRPGATYLHSDVLRVTRPGLTLVGTGSTLTATEETRSAVHVSGDRVSLTGLTLTLATSTQRFHAYEQMKLRVSGDDVVLRDVHVRGAAAAGIYVGNGAARFLLDRVTVTDSRADGVHVTGGARDGRVVSPVTTNTGDDGVAVVSYRADGRPVERVRISSPRVNGTTWGRGISVVGGTDITYTDVDVRDTDAGGVYLGSEGDPYWTFPSVRVLVDGGRVTGANTNPDKDHGAVIVYAGNPGTTTADVTVRRLTIAGTRATAPWDVGVLAGPGATVTRVTLTDLTLTDGARSPFWTNVPAAVRLVGVRDDGVAVANRLGW